MQTIRLNHMNQHASMEPIGITYGPAASISANHAISITEQERTRLVQICLRATHDPDAAEDLAQETLLEAWRQWHKLHDAGDPEARARWLAAIATNICRRWARRTGRELAHTERLHMPPASGASNDTREMHEAPEEQLAAGEDEIDAELERGERAALLERAMGLLPPQTREVLVARYVLETPLGEIAARNGLSEAMLSVRLHRGRHALRTLLATTLREEALAFGLLPQAEADGWQETRIWCPLCGQSKMHGLLDDAHSSLVLRCPRCAPTMGRFLDHVCGALGLFVGVKSFKSALNRVMIWADPYYRRGLERREVFCYRCRRMSPLRLGLSPTAHVSVGAELAFHATCTCPAVNNSNLAGTALYTPQGRHFWREHPRIRLVAPYNVETGGREAIVVGYESVTGSARFDALFARDTFELLEVHESPSA